MQPPGAPPIHHPGVVATVTQTPEPDAVWCPLWAVVCVYGVCLSQHRVDLSCQVIIRVKQQYGSRWTKQVGQVKSGRVGYLGMQEEE